MEFRVLGPFEAREGERVVSPGGGKRRALLARLVLDANRVVSVEALIDDLWETPPETATKMVQVYVSQLRKVLPEGTLRTRPPGYVLEVPAGGVDLERFEALLAEGRRRLAAGSAAEASERLEQALALWYGPALSEFDEPFARAEARRLAELRLSALEERIEADLALGRQAEVVSELEALVAHHPLRERLRAQQMLALYRLGRHAEALAAYQSFRRTLDDELGIEPSARLKELERRMLRQDAALDATAAPAAIPPIEPVEHEIRYARSGDVSIAYQVVSEGVRDLVLVHGWVCTFQPGWENPTIARFYRRLASMGRLILFDKRGTGLSDRVSTDRLPDLETRMDDVRAVMDAVGSERAVLLGVSEGGPMCTLFAATYPGRTAALGLMGTFARLMWAPDYPFGLGEEKWRTRLAASEEGGRAVAREWLGRVAPEIASDKARLRWYESYIMRGASPGATRALRLMNREIDVRHVLPAIRVPTLVVYRSDEEHSEATRYMGERIPGARIVELPGNEHLPWEGDQDALLGEVERFLAGLEQEAEPDRVLVTVLFGDLVAAPADRQERHELFEQGRGVVQHQLVRYRGRAVDDGGGELFAVFDGPARAIRCACSIADEVRGLGLELRAGLHTGEVELVDGTVEGLAVETGARVAAKARPGEVLVSQTVRDLVAGSGLEFEDRGRHTLEGVPGEWQLLAVRPT